VTVRERWRGDRHNESEGEVEGRQSRDVIALSVTPDDMTGQSKTRMGYYVHKMIPF
jgi:hypothetical protein